MTEEVKKSPCCDADSEHISINENGDIIYQCSECLDLFIKKE